MEQFVCRDCGYVFSAENEEPDYDELVETDDPMDEMVCPACGGIADVNEE
jgi:rubredoxin